MTLLDELAQEGYILQAEPFMANQSESLVHNLDSARQLLLNTDIRKLLNRSIQKSPDGAISFSTFPTILQITSIKNIGQSSRHQFTDRMPQTLQVSFTDGFMNVIGVVISKIAGMTVSANAGAKIKITRPVLFFNGRLFLSSENCEFIGGVVYELLQAWKAEKMTIVSKRKVAGANSRTGIDNVRPEFEAFQAASSVSRRSASSAPVPSASSVFSPKPSEHASNKSSGSGSGRSQRGRRGRVPSSRHSERHDDDDSVRQDSKDGSHDHRSSSSRGRSRSGGRRKGRRGRGRRHNDEDDYSTSRIQQNTLGDVIDFALFKSAR